MGVLDFLVTAQVSVNLPCIDVIAICPSQCTCNVSKVICPMDRIVVPVPVPFPAER